MSAQKRRQKSLKEHSQNRKSAPKRKLFVSLGILAGLAFVIAVLLVVKSGRETEESRLDQLLD